MALTTNPYKRGSTLAWTLKGHLRHHPITRASYLKARSLYKSLWANASFLAHVSRERLWRAVFGFSRRAKSGSLQQVMTWDVSLPQFEKPDELISWFRARSIQLHEGRHTVYIPPQKELMNLIPLVVRFYPPNSGFKILKDFRSPSDANYLTGKSRLIGRTKLIGTPHDQLVTANYMYVLGIGPRMWDLCCWRSGSTRHTVFVVDHVFGSSSSSQQCMDFLERLKQVLLSSRLRIVLADWERHRDFSCPDCNHNLVQSNAIGCPQYVDFQNFLVINSLAWSEDIIAQAKDLFHFGSDLPLKGGVYPYQPIRWIFNPRKPNMTKQWVLIQNQLRAVGLDLRGRVVLDVGCNAGMMLHLSLAAGATWGLGWDHPSLVQYAEQLLLSLGSSRFYLTGADPDPLHPLEEDIPVNLLPALPEAVVFLSAARKHAGFQSLKRIPWRALVYEGLQGDRLEDIPKIFAPLLTNDVHCAGSSYISDGESAARPVVILLRS